MAESRKEVRIFYKIEAVKNQSTNPLPLAAAFIAAAVLCLFIYEGVVRRAKVEG